MGNWNWQHRRRYRHNSKSTSRYEELPPPIPQPGLQDNVPLWEKQFCSSVGSVPWWKVVEAKKLMYCHSNVVNWNDSAVEEAFHTAKQRFWAEINGLPCDICLPDPDIYIDEIAWNSYIDPELILDLDRAYVCPNEAGVGTQNTADMFSGSKGHHVESGEPVKIKATGWGDWDEPKNVACSNNPWEQSCTADSGALKDLAWQGIPCVSGVWTQVENSGNDPKNLDSGNKYAVGSGATKKNPWKDSQDKSRGWNKGENYRSRDLGIVINPSEPTGEGPWKRSYAQNNQATDGWGTWDRNRNQVEDCTHQSNKLDDGNSSPWEHGFQGPGSVKDKGRGDTPDDSWGSKDWRNSKSRTRNSYDNRQWGCGAVANNAVGENGNWKIWEDTSWRRKQWENGYNNGAKRLESRPGNGNWETWNGGCRKREGSSHHTPRYNKNSRFQADDRQMNNKRGPSQKRVSFV